MPRDARIPVKLYTAAEAGALAYEATLQEREACARLAEGMQYMSGRDSGQAACQKVAAAIRYRSKGNEIEAGANDVYAGDPD